MKYLLYIICCFVMVQINAQDDIYPAPKAAGTIVIKNATIHVGNNTIIEGGSIVIKDGKIEMVGQNATATGGTVIDATGKQVYPGLILSNTDLGLKEIGSGVRGSNDYYELGDYNSNIKSLVAYDADSRVINTLRSNGILLANIVPDGKLITGSSSVVQLDAWNWEDALYKSDNGIHINMPLLMTPPQRFFRMQNTSDPVKEGIKILEDVTSFLLQAKAYNQQNKKTATNLKFEALKPLFDKKQKLFVHADMARQILMGIDFAKSLGVDVVIVGGSDSYMVAGLLKQNNIPVILNALHNLPTMEDDDVDQPFKTPAILKKQGVLFAINDNDDNSRYRNLAFNAGTAASYGLTKEEALQAITLDAAKILGIDDRTGSLEVGKDANIIIASGDIMDMDKSIITDAFIEGRKISLENKHTQLYERYLHKYNLK